MGAPHVAESYVRGPASLGHSTRDAAAQAAAGCLPATFRVAQSARQDKLRTAQVFLLWHAAPISGIARGRFVLRAGDFLLATNQPPAFAAVNGDELLAAARAATCGHRAFYWTHAERIRGSKLEESVADFRLFVGGAPSLRVRSGRKLPRLHLSDSERVAQKSAAGVYERARF